MRRPMRLTSIFLYLAASSVLSAREFGPEWTAVRDPRSQQISEYRKEVKVLARSCGLFRSVNYDIPLESDDIHIVELDDNKGFYIENIKYGRFELQKNANGTPAWHLVRFPKVHYWDLNGDGFFDLMQDRRGPFANDHTDQITYIFLEGCFVPIWGGARGGSETRTAYSPDRQIEYVFEGGKWRIKK